MQPDARKLLNAILGAAKDVRQFTTGKSLVDLRHDKLLRGALYWSFSVIGEAMAQLRQVDASTYDLITDSWKIVGFRNQIIHGYSKIDDGIPWDIVQNKLPVLINEVSELLA